MKNVLKNEQGFSIVELLIVIVLLAVISITATSLLYTSLGSSGKASGIAVVKQSGDQAIQYIERQIRGSRNAACVDLGGGVWVLQLTDQAGTVVDIQMVNDVTSGMDRIAYTGPIFITSAELSASNFSCNLSSTGNFSEPDIVEVAFTLEISPGSRPSEATRITFQTRTSLRTY